eukprot:UN18444
MKKNILIPANFKKFYGKELVMSHSVQDSLAGRMHIEPSELVGYTIDVVLYLNEYTWERYPQGNKQCFPSLLLQLPYIMNVGKLWKHT